VYDEFDFTILSAEVGVGKPDVEIYQLALAKLPNVQPSEVVFVDDQEAFLEPAKSLGIVTVHAQSTEQVITEVTQLVGV